MSQVQEERKRWENANRLKWDTVAPTQIRAPIGSTINKETNPTGTINEDSNKTKQAKEAVGSQGVTATQ